MQPWTKKNSLLRGQRFVTTLEPLERELLGDSAATVAGKLMERARTAPKDELAELTGMPSGHAEAPADPGLARLLPSFFSEDAEQIEGDAALTRQLNETDIIKSKLINLQYVTEALGPAGSVALSLSAEEVNPWLAALSDIRNYHYAHLEAEARSLGFSAQDPVDELSTKRNYVDWLGFCQDSLLHALMGDLDLPEEFGESGEGSEGNEDR